jgi:hypothetical protein
VFLRDIGNLLRNAPGPAALRLALAGNERSARGLFTALFIYAGVAIGTFGSSRVQHALILNTHFRPTSTFAWVFLQPAPKMYGIANRVWVRNIPPLSVHSIAVPFESRSVWVNHYPARYARFDGERQQTSLPKSFVIRGSYRDTSVWTTITVEDGHPAFELHVSPLDP